ncbi:hypothetical protein ACLI36_34930, partial [Pseudomonas aeruginosa]
MPTAWLDLPAPPALPGLFLRAALRRGLRGKALPERGLRRQVTGDPNAVAYTNPPAPDHKRKHRCPLHPRKKNTKTTKQPHT